MSASLRPLPSRPNLEFERKEAKALLRQLHAGEPAALERARERHPAIASHALEQIQLSDAQLIVAREYGFSSWPWLVRYYGEASRQTIRASTSLYAPEEYESVLRHFLAGHAKRRASIGRAVAAYVPRFYGMRVEDVYESAITEDEAKLAIARQNCCATWDVLLERATSNRAAGTIDWAPNKLQAASAAMRSGNLLELQQLVSAHQGLLNPPESMISRGTNLMRMALQIRTEVGEQLMQPIIAWLESHGMSAQRELNSMLCGHMYMKVDEVRTLLAQGANPDWIAANGFSAIEHAIMRYWNGDAVDLVAANAKPRRALWVAAGLGDVAGVRQFLDRSGKPTTAARDDRPDFAAIGPVTIPCVPTASDEEVLMEAFTLAVVNGRTNVIEYMVSRGFNVDSLVWDSPALVTAVGNGWTRAVECLIKCGANPDLRGTPNGTAREMALQMLENQPPSADRRRIAELCGIDPDAALAARDGRLHPTPPIHPKLKHSIELAIDDAARLGHADVSEENLLFGLLRFGELALGYFTQLSRMDVQRFHAEVADRVNYGHERIETAPLPMQPGAQALIDRATAFATERRRDHVGAIHLLFALTSVENGIAAQYLRKYGANVDDLNAQLMKAL